MHRPLLALARNPKFIPLVYDYCDTWCERCPVTDRCLLFASKRHLDAMAGDETIERVIEAGLEFARTVAEACSPNERTVASLDVRLASPTTAPREPAIGHPLEFLARHYAIQTSAFLSTLRCEKDGRLPHGSPLELLDWYDSTSLRPTRPSSWTTPWAAPDWYWSRSTVRSRHGRRSPPPTATAGSAG